jgi:hypothetical protein
MLLLLLLLLLGRCRSLHTLATRMWGWLHG